VGERKGDSHYTRAVESLQFQGGEELTRPQLSGYVEQEVELRDFGDWRREDRQLTESVTGGDTPEK